MRKKCEKLRKMSPTWAQDPPKRPKIIFTAAYAKACLARTYYLRMNTILKEVLFNHAGERTPAHCLRFANPAEAATNSANMAGISAKLRQHAFRTICNFQFFDTKKEFEKEKIGFFFFGKNFGFGSVFHYFRWILEELGLF